MKRLLSLLACLLLLSAPLTVGMAAGDDNLARLVSVQADFTQEKHLKILARPLISRGVFAFQAPQSLRWEYLTPLHSIMIMHDGRIDKVIERDGRFERENGDGIGSMQIILQEIGNWLGGRFADNPMFAVSRPDAQTVILTPKEQGLTAVISRIELRLGQQAGVMESVTIFEGSDAWTRLTFANPVLNRVIPESRFHLQ
jgi:outer membrane lipoprotein-sorting protein